MKQNVSRQDDLLQKILRCKRERLKFIEEETPLVEIQNAATTARSQRVAHSLRERLLRDGINVIAEFKKRSPSKGIIRPGADPVELARSYQSSGAVAISVLTEEDHFDGSLQDLRDIRNSIDLPVLRKDFIFHAYQIYEAAAAGADAVLLIVAALDDASLQNLRELAEVKLGMDALVEVHDEFEMSRAQACGAILIGVNNRNLRTFEVSLDVSTTLARHSSQAILVSESGLQTHQDLQSLREIGYRGFLVGEFLMRSEDPGQALRALIEG